MAGEFFEVGGVGVVGCLEGEVEEGGAGEEDGVVDGVLRGSHAGKSHHALRCLFIDVDLRHGHSRLRCIDVGYVHGTMR
ncbi:hypothetical protein, partial [Streptomyces sp. BE20]|uniref:hypothetical protein n=1 Tax=Streptomyces sp. BE20 TaxID=3002525 RepID=UPI002E7A404D